MQKGDIKRCYAVENKKLHKPPLHELANVINAGLQTNFKESSCEVVKCPDLSQAPFGLAAPGICGKARLAEIGGVPNLLPNTQYIEKVYSLEVRILKYCATLFSIAILAGSSKSNRSSRCFYDRSRCWFETYCWL